MPDVIVMVPGILGSVLAKNGRDVWGAPMQSAIGNLLTFGRALKDLKLESGIGHGDPNDGVTAPRVMPRLGIIPRFWKVDGYGELTEQLHKRFILNSETNYQPGNFIEFPYDWRLSNQLSAARLAETVVPRLERWRKFTNNRDAKLILICHSMGGLVARYFLELLGGREITRELITIGTPFRGSIKALDALANGLYIGLGSIGLTLDELVRSFPSVYQLLPTYPCFDVGADKLVKLDAVDLPNVNKASVREGLAFHSRISSTVELAARYQTFVIKGIDQPTAQSVVARRGELELLFKYNGVDYTGDGTVPRPSSHPPEWADDSASVFASQMHSMLQSTESVLTQLFGILTNRLGNFMGGARIGLDVPDLVQLGCPINIEAISKDGDPSLPLNVICQAEQGRWLGDATLMRPTGDGRYNASIGGLSAGAWRITVASASPRRPVEPVSSWTLVWNPESVA